MSYYDLMKNSCDNIGIEFDREKYDKFILYMRLLQEWNEKINLTAITEDKEIIEKHFIDCINAFSLQQFKECKNVIDVGTGAGFPGIPLAIMREDLQITLLDSLNKRINFLDVVVNKLNLKNVTTIHSRAEDGARNPELREKFDVATSRAVANMTVLSEFCIPYVKVGGYFIALKGPAVTEELNDSKNALGKLGGKLRDVKEVIIEGTDLSHNLVVVEKMTNTPKAYPRKAGSIVKKPLK